MGKTDRFVFFSKHTVRDAASGTRYTPFIASDGRVGYSVERIVDGSLRSEYIYFNPSSTEGDDTPNVFVYIGSANDPSEDEPQHFYTLGVS